MTTRVYIPSSPDRLQAITGSAGIRPAPFLAHAVTDVVRGELADGGDEEWEYAASSAAAQSPLVLLHDGEPARRVVVAVEVPEVRVVGPDDPTLVEVVVEVPFAAISAVLADSADAENTVTAAREALQQGALDAEGLAERCLGHELGWWASQELGELFSELFGEGGCR